MIFAARFRLVSVLSIAALCCGLILTISASAKETPVAPAASVKIGQTTWSADLPNARAAGINCDASAGTVTLAVNENTDMWGARNNAPILYSAAPSGNFVVETRLAYPSTSASAVAGVCVYPNIDGGKPAFTFGLDHWGGSQKVKFQGLPPSGNNPGQECAQAGCTEVFLRLEVYRKQMTKKATDIYVGKYKFKSSDSWQLCYVLGRDVPCDRVGLFLKTNAAQTCAFSEMKIEPLADDAVPAEKLSAPARLAAARPAPIEVMPVEPKPILAAATDHPAMKAVKKLLFVARPQYRGDHHNTATMFQTGEINTGSFSGNSALRFIDYTDGGRVTTLLKSPQGMIRDPDVSFDGKKVLFSMRRNREDDYHLYEIGGDGTGLRQLTFGSGISDIDPIYLPDGRIMFGSTREPKYCMCNRHIMCNLFTMEADGANIQQIGHSTLHEGHPALLPDGRILYDRWEYVDRNFGDAQGVWVTNPDGTNHAVYWGNNTNSPGAVLDTRPIPGTTLVVATFSSCHDRPWGALAIIDRTLGIDMREPVLRTWPESAIDLIGKGNYDTYKRVTPKYEDPFPLSQDAILCARQIPGRGERTGIYLATTDAQDVLVYAEPNDSPLGCFDPMLLEARPVPRNITSRIDLAKKTGVFYVSNVYDGTGMEAIEPGTVRWLRIVESPEKRNWTQQAWNGSGTQAPGMAWNDFNNKRIIGTVPVEEDGSAHFEVPADTFVYFQLLDAEGRMVQSMRSGTIVRPGEQQGCIGCHEDRLNAVPPRQTVKALLRGPDTPKPWYGEPRLFSYLIEVQPVFDRHCVKCHDIGEPGAKKVCLAGDLNIAFNCSYFELRKNRGLVNVPGAGPFRVLNPRSWGSYVSPLAKVMLEGHGDEELDEYLTVLTQEDRDRVITWIDINAPYYPSYASAYRDNRYGRSPIDGGQLGRLGKLTGINLNDQGQANMVFFTRPEKSPCLAKLEPSSEAYREALAIITAGRTNLAERPRADMPGFKLVYPVSITAEEKYQRQLELERQRMQAIVAGERIYDPKPETEEEPET